MSAVTKKPSIWAYIGAWLLAAVASNSIANLIEPVLGDALIRSKDDLAIGLLIIPIISSALTLVIWICVYNEFKSLNVRRVIPYIWVLGILAIVLGSYLVEEEYRKFGLKVPITYYISTIVGFVGFVALFSLFFKRKGRVY